MEITEADRAAAEEIYALIKAGNYHYFTVQEWAEIIARHMEPERQARKGTGMVICEHGLVCNVEGSEKCPHKREHIPDTPNGHTPCWPGCRLAPNEVARCIPVKEVAHEG